MYWEFPRLPSCLLQANIEAAHQVISLFWSTVQIKCLPKLNLDPNLVGSVSGILLIRSIFQRKTISILFNLFRIETSRVWVLVGSNPRLLNATAMAELLNQQVESIRERAERQVGVIIDSFAAGDEVRKLISFHTTYKTSRRYYRQLRRRRRGS